MVKLAVLFTAGLVAFAGLATAKSCQKGKTYCGHGLLKKGDYYNNIVADLSEHGQQTDSSHINESLFNCGEKGAIGFISYCGDGCVNGGAGKNDFCS